MVSKGTKKMLSIFLGVSMCAVNVVPAFAETVPNVQAQAEQIVSKMTLEEKVGQMMMPDFRNWNKSSVNTDGQLTVENSNEPQGFTEMNDEVAGVIQKYHLGGVILFQPNVQNTEQTVRLTEGLQKASPKIPLLLTIDQEGGLVTRLMSGTVMPGNMALGATNDSNISYNVGKAIGEELNALGINTNFAPDMDVNLNPNNPVIGVRSFGGDPDLVSRMGIGYIKGLMDAKVIGTIKHFPGHGDVATDSHLGLPLVNKPIEELNKVELKPFKAASDAGVDMIMTAHIEYPTLDNTQVVSKLDGSNIYLPATLSKKILTDLVRGQFGFKGVVVTDALNMKAIADNFGQEEAVIRCINAGVDIALMPAQMWNLDEVKNFDKVYNAVINAVKDGTIAQSRIDEAVTRIITLKIKREILNPNGTAGIRTIDQKIDDAKAVVGSAAHKAIEKEAADKAVTLVKNDNNILPFKLAEGSNVVLFGNSYPSATNRLKSMTNGLTEVMSAQGIKNVNIKTFDYNTSSKNCYKTLTEEMKAAVDGANYVVLGTYNVNDNEDRKAFSNAVLEYAKSKNKPAAVISIRNPYDLSYLNNVQAYIATYGAYGTNEGSPVMPNISAGIRAIFGLVNPTGKLPVALPDAANAGKNLYEIGFGLIYNTTIEQANELIAKASKSLSIDDYNAALKFVNDLPNCEAKTTLLNKLAEVKKAIDTKNSNPTDNKNNDNTKDNNNTNNTTTQNTTNTSSEAIASSLPKTGSPVDFSSLLALGVSLVAAGGYGIRKKKAR
jgi:beta-N-acetylhexosaminidase